MPFVPDMSDRLVQSGFPAALAEELQTLIQGGVSGGGTPRRRNTGRRTIFAYGNSIPAQSSNSLSAGSFVNSVAALSGTKVLTVTGDQTATFTAASKIAVALHTGEVFKTTVASSAFGTSTQITLTDPLPKYVRASASAAIVKYTTASPSGINRDIGELTGAVALLGGDIDVVQGYSHGGNLSSDGMVEFTKWIRTLAPDFVYLRLFDNDIPGLVPLATLQNITAYYARIALATGVTPIFATPVPNSSVNTAPKCALWDSMRDWMLQIPANIPGALVVNTSTWLDPANIATSRAPLSTVASDGIHPDNSARFYVANLVSPQLAALFTTGAYGYLKLGAVSANPTMTGTAGVNSGTGGAATPTGSVADSWTVEAAGTNVVCTNSKNADGSQKILFSVVGTGNYSSTVAYLRQTVTPAASGPQFGAFQGLKPVFKIKVNSLSGMDSMLAQLVYSGGESYGTIAAAHFNTANFTTIVSKTIVLEGPAISVPEGATNVQLRLMFRPTTGATNPAADIDIIEGFAVPDVEQAIV